MYPGTRGRTHGDRNEIVPAANAAMIDMSAIVEIIS
jgi:hypothetical protein